MANNKSEHRPELIEARRFKALRRPTGASPWSRPLQALSAFLLTTAFAQCAFASENAPHRPFALWADVPDSGQFVFGVVYEESEAYHIWANRDYHNVRVKSNGENYGIDINQGYFALQYGLTERWAADLNIGATTAGWRYFDNGPVKSTTGLMDVSFGVRYQIFNEATAYSPWTPTLTFRAGAVLPGTFDQDLPFAPGLRSASIEPEFLARKHFGWTGLGAYADTLYRWNRTTGNDQYIAAVGLFQQIKGWEIDVGFRHLQTISGGDIILTLNPDGTVNDFVYPRDVREISDAIEAGFSYTMKCNVRLGFHSRAIIDGSNTDNKFWIGGSIDIPFGGRSAK
jgi:hypothetical protein